MLHNPKRAKSWNEIVKLYFERHLLASLILLNLVVLHLIKFANCYAPLSHVSSFIQKVLFVTFLTIFKRNLKFLYISTNQNCSNLPKSNTSSNCLHYFVNSGYHTKLMQKSKMSFFQWLNQHQQTANCENTINCGNAGNGQHLVHVTDTFSKIPQPYIIIIMIKSVQILCRLTNSAKSVWANL